MLRLLEKHDPSASQYLSAFSLALTRVALADNSIDEREREMMRSALVGASDLSEGEVDLVMELAASQVRCQSALRGENDSLFTEEQRRHFIDSLHAVASADGQVSQDELVEIEMIARELGFP